MPPFYIFELLATSSCFFFRSEAACRITHSSSFSRAAARDSIASCEIKKRDAGASTTDEIDDVDGSVEPSDRHSATSSGYGRYCLLVF